jgi:hypothetical protein
MYVDVDNKGYADAEDIFLYLVLKYESTPKETLAVDLARISKITNARPLTQMWSLSLEKKSNLTCFIEARYTWTIQNTNYKEKKYFYFIHEQEPERYRIRILNDVQIKEFWGS